MMNADMQLGVRMLSGRNGLLVGTALAALFLGVLAVVARQFTGGMPVIGCSTPREQTIQLLLLAFYTVTTLHLGLLAYTFGWDGSPAQLWQRLAKAALALPLVLFFVARILNSPCL